MVETKEASFPRRADALVDWQYPANSLKDCFYVGETQRRRVHDLCQSLLESLILEYEEVPELVKVGKIHAVRLRWVVVVRLKIFRDCDY